MQSIFYQWWNWNASFWKQPSFQQKSLEENPSNLLSKSWCHFTIIKVTYHLFIPNIFLIRDNIYQLDIDKQNVAWILSYVASRILCQPSTGSAWVLNPTFGSEEMKTDTHRHAWCGSALSTARNLSAFIRTPQGEGLAILGRKSLQGSPVKCKHPGRESCSCHSLHRLVTCI